MRLSACTSERQKDKMFLNASQILLIYSLSVQRADVLFCFDFFLMWFIFYCVFVCPHKAHTPVHMRAWVGTGLVIKLGCPCADPLAVYSHKGDLSKAWGDSINQPKYFELRRGLLAGTHTHIHTHQYTERVDYMGGHTLLSAPEMELIQTGPQCCRWMEREAMWGQPPLNY